MVAAQRKVISATRAKEIIEDLGSQASAVMFWNKEADLNVSDHLAVYWT